MKLARFLLGAATGPLFTVADTPDGVDNLMEYVLFECVNNGLEVDACAAVMRQKLDDQFSSEYGCEFTCVVESTESLGIDGAEMYVGNRGWVAYHGSRSAMCDRKSDREPNQDLLNILCTSAHNTCGTDRTCMRLFIQGQTVYGDFDMCRSKFNLMLTPAKWAGSGQNIIGAYDGAFADCIIYCTEY